MARTEDEDSRRGAGAARLARTVGHPASGGHASSLRPASRINRSNWERDHHPQRQRGPMAYEYQEYPKWVHPEGQPSLVVQDYDEEQAALGGDPIVREADERIRLLKVGEVKGVKIDKRWSVENMKAAIIGAGHDPDLDPFK